MIIDIIDLEVDFSSILIKYEVYHSTRMNISLGYSIHTTYQMIRENVDYNLCEAMREKIFLNNENIKKGKRQPFYYIQVLMGLEFLSQYWKHYLVYGYTDNYTN